jgi:hypothetical protein
LGVNGESSSPEDMRRFVSSEVKRWNDVIDKASLARIE